MSRESVVMAGRLPPEACARRWRRATDMSARAYRWLHGDEKRMNRLLLALVLLLQMLFGTAARAADPELLVFAAASLTNVLEQLGPMYTKQTGQPVKFSFAASSALARQLE